MNAQELIDLADGSEQDNMSFFYPEIVKHKQADENITKVLRDLD